MKNSRFEIPKDGEARIAPIQQSLAPILAAYRLMSGGRGLLFRPLNRRGGRPGSPPTFMRPNTLASNLYTAQDDCELPRTTWYQSTRHTFASHWAMAGGSVMSLSQIMGHSGVEVTERYARLLPGHYRESEYAMLDVDLRSDDALTLAQRTTKTG